MILGIFFKRKGVVKIALKEIHVGGKLIDSNYCNKKFYTQEKFAEGQSILMRCL